MNWACVTINLLCCRAIGRRIVQQAFITTQPDVTLHDFFRFATQTGRCLSTKVD
jgi:hypothetical protein